MPIRRFVLTGAPGSGKTTLAEALRARGHTVIAEAATDLIAQAQAGGDDEPWRDQGFPAGYERDTFLVRPLGFVTPTVARRITYAESLEFEQVHIDVYREHGHRLIDVPPMTVPERVALIEAHRGVRRTYSRRSSGL